MRRTKAMQTLAPAGALVLALLGTGVSDAQIPQTLASPHAAPPDQALLLFSRPRRRQASEVTIRIVNQAGRCLAVLDDGWQVAAPMWPGKHMLMVVTGTAPPTIQLMEAKLSAGKTYVVNLRLQVNVKSPVDIEVVRRQDQPFEAFPAELREHTPARQDLRECTDWVYWKRAKIRNRAAQAKRRWDEGTEEQRDRQTVRRNDGWTAAEVAKP